MVDLYLSCTFGFLNEIFSFSDFPIFSCGLSDLLFSAWRSPLHFRVKLQQWCRALSAFLACHTLCFSSESGRQLCWLSIAVGRSFSFITETMAMFLVFRVSAEVSADCLMGVPLYVSSCFFLAVSKILPLSLIFAA